VAALGTAVLFNTFSAIDLGSNVSPHQGIPLGTAVIPPTGGGSTPPPTPTPQTRGQMWPRGDLNGN
jgi:hypothetical protein